MKMKWVLTRPFVVCGLLTVVIFATLRAQEKSREDTKPFQAVSRPGCHYRSWTPEVFSFYGDPAQVTVKLDNFDMDLPNRRILMFIVETTNEAQLSLYELNPKEVDKFHLWTWKGKSARDLREKATETILANKGIECVGDQIKGLVKGLKPDVKGDMPGPKTARDAFGPVILGYGTEYIRLTVFLLC